MIGPVAIRTRLLFSTSAFPRGESRMTPDVFVPKAESICLFLDVDGTLIDLAPTPDAVVVSSALLEELSLAERRLDGALALVSGRPIAELDRLFAPIKLRASGVHGAEIRYSPFEPTRSR